MRYVSFRVSVDGSTPIACFVSSNISATPDGFPSASNASLLKKKRPLLSMVICIRSWERSIGPCSKSVKLCVSIFDLSPDVHSMHECTTHDTSLQRSFHAAGLIRHRKHALKVPPLLTCGLLHLNQHAQAKQKGIRTTTGQMLSPN